MIQLAADILVLDFGTSELKVVLYGEDFREIDHCSHTWSYSYPAPLCIEHPVEAYWTAALRAMRRLLDVDGRAQRLAAISVTGQAETLIGLDGEGKPVGDAIVWLDTRAQRECARLGELVDADQVYRRTGNPGFDPVMPVCKLPWLREHQPERYRATKTFLLIKEYIVYKLTGRIVGEFSALSCSGYFNIVRRDYDDELLRAARIDRDLLPDPADSLEVIGPLRGDLARELGVPGDVRVVNGMLDQCASAIGAGNVRPGIITETTGTVLGIAATVPAFEPERMQSRVVMLCHGLPGEYLALPNCPTAGVLLKWFRERFVPEGEWAGHDDAFDYICEQVDQRPPNPEGIVVLPHFSGRLSPVHAPDARGAVIGLTLGTDKFDIARAILESVGFLLRENLEMLLREGIRIDEVRSLGGGSKSPVWEQIKADICQRELTTMMDEQSTALGCALGAALALGMIRGAAELGNYVRIKKAYRPRAELARVYDQLYGRYLRLNEQMGYGAN